LPASSTAPSRPAVLADTAVPVATVTVTDPDAVIDRPMTRPMTRRDDPDEDGDETTTTTTP